MTRDALISYVPATGGPRLYSEVVVVPRSRGVVRKCAELVERTVARRSVYISSLLLHAVSLSPLSLRDARARARHRDGARTRTRSGGRSRASFRPSASPKSAGAGTRRGGSRSRRPRPRRRKSLAYQTFGASSPTSRRGTPRAYHRCNRAQRGRVARAGGRQARQESLWGERQRETRTRSAASQRGD